MTCLLHMRATTSHPRMLSGGVGARSKKRIKDLTNLDGLSRGGTRKLIIIIITSYIYYHFMFEIPFNEIVI